MTLRPLPGYTWQALRLVPAAFLTVGGGLSALSWITHRKERLKKEREEQAAAAAETRED